MEVAVIDLSERQKEILEIVKALGPISGEEIAARLNVSRAALRPCLAVLTMSGLLAARPRAGYYFTGKETNSRWPQRLKVVRSAAVLRCGGDAGATALLRMYFVVPSAAAFGVVSAKIW